MLEFKMHLMSSTPTSQCLFAFLNMQYFEVSKRRVLQLQFALSPAWGRTRERNVVEMGCSRQEQRDRNVIITVKIPSGPLFFALVSCDRFLYDLCQSRMAVRPLESSRETFHMSASRPVAVLQAADQALDS
jgi:hypothetical protein